MSNLARYNPNPVGISRVPSLGLGFTSDLTFSSDIESFDIAPFDDVEAITTNRSSYPLATYPYTQQSKAFLRESGVASASLLFNDSLLMNAEAWEASLGLTNLDLEMTDYDQGFSSDELFL